MNNEVRLIDANALIMAENQRLSDTPYVCTIDNMCYAWEEMPLKDVIESHPTIEAEPVRHGSWSEVKTGNDAFDYYFRCSDCGKNTPNRAYLISPDWCPNCGAKMDGGTENA